MEKARGECLAIGLQADAASHKPIADRMPRDFRVRKCCG